MDINDILTSHQFGFRKSHSTDLAVVDMYDNLLQKVDNKDYTCAIFLDLAKAFDSVNHKILLAKLNKYGIRGIALQLYESYLSNRWQYVKLQDIESDRQPIYIDIPKDLFYSSSLLFLIYLNDLRNVSNFFVKLFSLFEHKLSKFSRTEN